MKNKIGWCNTTWNPVWGCKEKCEYCYARGIAKRFWKQMLKVEINHQERSQLLEGLKNFKPTFLKSNYDKIFPKKPQRIFVGSMSEIAYWDEVWIERVIEKVKQYPQHTFQFLTKFPEVYMGWVFPKNCWLGVTITKSIDIWSRGNGYYGKYFKLKNIKFISIEPILEKFTAIKFIDNFDWVIIGAETGNRKGKIIPKKEWVESIVNYCRAGKIPVYLKDSLKNIYPVEMKEFPKEEK